MNKTKLFLPAIGTILALTIGITNINAATPTNDTTTATSQKTISPPENFHDQYSKLTDQQRTNFRSIMKNMRSKTLPLSQALREKMDALSAEIKKDTIDSTAINKLTQEISELRSKIFQIYIESVIAIKKQTGLDFPMRPMMGKHHMVQKPTTK